MAAEELAQRLSMLAKLYAPDADTPQAMLEAAAILRSLPSAVRCTTNAVPSSCDVSPKQDAGEPRSGTAPSSSIAAISEHRYGDADLTLAELVEELPKIRRFYSGSAFQTVQHDINMLCDAVQRLAVSAITAPLSERLREVANEVERLKYVGTALTLRGIANALDLVDRRADSRGLSK